MAIYQLGDAVPDIDPTAFVAEGAVVIGRVTLGPQASVWYGCVLRGDNDPIRIGARSNVQDGSMMHSDPGFPLILGEDVTVGHQCMLHGCTVGDGSLIGIQAVVLNGARIGKGCLVGAGALVTEGAQFEDGWLILGAPAKAVKPISPEQLARLKGSAAAYVTKSALHRSQLKRID